MGQPPHRYFVPTLALFIFDSANKCLSVPNLPIARVCLCRRNTQQHAALPFDPGDRRRRRPGSPVDALRSDFR